MKYKLLFLKEAAEEFKKLDKAVQRIIKEKLEIFVISTKPPISFGTMWEVGD